MTWRRGSLFVFEEILYQPFAYVKHARPEPRVRQSGGAQLPHMSLRNPQEISGFLFVHHFTHADLAQCGEEVGPFGMPSNAPGAGSNLEVAPGACGFCFAQLWSTVAVAGRTAMSKEPEGATSAEPPR